MMPSELERSKLLKLRSSVREGLEARLLHGGGRLRVAFDDPDLVSHSGLVPAMELAESCDLHGIVAEHVRVDGHKGANPGGKVATLVAGMLTGADSIDDTDDLRSGGMPSLFGGIYAPSTLGEFLRALHHGKLVEPGGDGMVAFECSSRCALVHRQLVLGDVDGDCLVLVGAAEGDTYAGT